MRVVVLAQGMEWVAWLASTYFWLAGNEGMEKETGMETTRTGYVETTLLSS